MSDSVPLHDAVRAEVQGRLGVLTLTRPGALNALDLGMAVAARRQLDAWATDRRVAAVWLQGEGPKAFCAGGDVRAVVEACAASGSSDPARAYFEAEYRLDFLLHTYPKPVLVWGHGFVLGGGLGMLLGGSVRIVTDSTRLAMPEVRIGLFPDVGASWFLSRLGGVGAWLALTAARVTGGDAIDLGLADVFVPEVERDTLREALGQADLSSSDSVVGVVAPFVRRSGTRLLPARRARLDALVASCADDAALVQAVLALVDDPDPWIADGARTLRDGSPTAARVTLAHLRRCRTLGLADVFRADLALAVRASEGQEFAEGVRALLVDKGRAASWSPAAHEAVDAARIGALLDARLVPDPLADLVGTGRHERDPHPDHAV
ncbi:MAG: enoyl-CoA hydratase/isomerase family protein [Alphaproteobacteria bacterium]|nr:enoyl-CoA hydratase/isomerase family protein [Alphaproteobacteria bacterium]